MNARIRPEQPTDVEAIRAVLLDAFEQDGEARLVDALRGAGALSVSLVAEVDGTVVGHIAFSRVAIESNPSALECYGLAPLSVLSDHQRSGIGGELVRAGLDECRRASIDAVFVLGHPEYYARFGFEPAFACGFSFGDLGDHPAFRVRTLSSSSLEHASGSIEYHHVFQTL